MTDYYYYNKKTRFLSMYISSQKIPPHITQQHNSIYCVTHKTAAIFDFDKQKII